MLTADFAEAVRRSGQGMVDDMAANHGRPWGFPLQQIRTRVHFWFCELDYSVPLAMGSNFSESVPGRVTTFVREAGHLWILAHLSEVLGALEV